MNFIVISGNPVGCLWSCKLCRGDNKVVLVHHRKSLVEQIKRQGGMLLNPDITSTNTNKFDVILNSYQNVSNQELLKDSFLHPIKAFTSLSDALSHFENEVAVIFFFVKVFTTSRVMNELENSVLKYLRKKRTVLCIVDDTLANHEKLSELYPSELIMYGSTVTHASTIKDGLICGVHNRPSTFWCSNSVYAKKVIELLNCCELPCTLSRDSDLLLWKKLAVNCAINSVTCLSLLKIGKCGDNGRELMARITSEVAKVAQSIGIPLTEKEATDSLYFVLEKTGDHVSKMCSDVLNKRQTEIESLNGYVLRLAKKRKIPVPIIKATYLFITLIQDTYTIQLSSIQKGFKL